MANSTREPKKFQDLSEKELVTKFIKSADLFVERFNLEKIIKIERELRFHCKPFFNEKQVYFRADLTIFHSDKTLSIFEFKKPGGVYDNIGAISQLLMYHNLMQRTLDGRAGRMFLCTTKPDKISVQFIKEQSLPIRYLELNEYGITERWVEGVAA